MSKREKMADVKAERDYWREVAMKDWEPLLRELHFGRDGFNAEIAGKAAQATSMAFVSAFKSGGAENFMEMSFFDVDEPRDRYIVTVQKCNGMSPADKLKAAEKVIEHYQAKEAA